MRGGSPVSGGACRQLMPLPRHGVAPSVQEAEHKTAGEIHRPRAGSFLRHHAVGKFLIQERRRLPEPAALLFRHRTARGQRDDGCAWAMCGDRWTVAAP
jgi:hypothetical protein